MAEVAAIAMGLGMGLQAIGGFSAAQERRSVGRQQAKLIEKQAVHEEAQFRRKGETLKSSQQAALGASGVQLEGTPLLVMEETARQLEEDALWIREQGKEAAALARKQGEAGYWGEMLNTFGSLLTAGATVYQAFAPQDLTTYPGYSAGQTAGAYAAYPTINLGGGYSK